MNSPTICAIVLDYYGAEKTKKCLISLIGQGLKTVYILDNSDKSEAAATLRQAVNEVHDHGPDFELEVISAGQNLGFGNGVNYVIAHDQQTPLPHDYYLLLNNDAVAGLGLVRGLLTAIRKDPLIALASPRIVSSNLNREYGIWYHRYLGLLLSRPGRFRFHYFTGCCLMFSRYLVDNRILFAEAFFMYGEDTELGWRLTRQGKKMVCAKDVYVEHEYGPSVDRSSFFYEYHMARGHFLMSFKTYVHPVEIPFLVLTKLTAMVLRSIARTLRHRTFIPLKALCCASFRVENMESAGPKVNESRQTN